MQNTYQFHFFVLPMIFMPNPAVPYLCSQLASVTKGLCKQLLQANRFLPTSEETASDAAFMYPPGIHGKCSSQFSFFSTCFNRKMWSKLGDSASGVSRLTRAVQHSEAWEGAAFFKPTLHQALKKCGTQHIVSCQSQREHMSWGS